MFQWKSESPWKTQCRKKGYKKKTSLGTKQNNHQPKKIGKACTPSHATLLLKMLHHWHGFLTGFVSKQGFVDRFFHDFPCCPNSPAYCMYEGENGVYIAVWPSCQTSDHQQDHIFCKGSWDTYYSKLHFPIVLSEGWSHMLPGTLIAGLLPFAWVFWR